MFLNCRRKLKYLERTHTCTGKLQQRETCRGSEVGIWTQGIQELSYASVMPQLRHNCASVVYNSEKTQRKQASNTKICCHLEEYHILQDILWPKSRFQTSWEIIVAEGREVFVSKNNPFPPNYWSKNVKASMTLPWWSVLSVLLSCC